MNKYSMLYRDANNYKFHFIIETDLVFEHEQEIEYEQIGFTQQRFHDEVVKFDYDEESDHNLLDVSHIVNEHFPVEYRYEKGVLTKL